MEDHTQNQSQAEETHSKDTNNCAQELAQLQQKYVYLQAEIDNYKKRTEKERLQWMQSAQSAVLSDLLEIVDDFERALQQSSNDTTLGAHLTGFAMIEKALQKLLKKYDVQEIPQTNIFDARIHDAIMQVASDKHTSGEVVQTLQKGYTFKGNVLRPAKVSVAQ